jgi:hypothetical protein
MHRRLFNALTVLSLAASVAVCALWVRSYHTWDLLRIGCGARWFHLSSRTGVFVPGTWVKGAANRPDPALERPSYQTLDPVAADRLLDEYERISIRRFSVAGIRYYELGPPFSSQHLIVFPWWTLQCLSLVAPSYWLVARRRRRYRRTRGFSCERDDDARATPRGSPECEATVPVP